MKRKIYIIGNKNNKLIKTIGTPTTKNISFWLNPQNSFVYFKIRFNTIKLNITSVKKYKSFKSKYKEIKLIGNNNKYIENIVNRPEKYLLTEILFLNKTETKITHIVKKNKIKIIPTTFVIKKLIKEIISSEYNILYASV